MSKKKKKQKQKVTYYDDNSTIVDMSSANRKGVKKDAPPKQNSTAKDKWTTYWNAVKMMIKPMLVVIMILCGLFLIALLIGRNFN